VLAGTLGVAALLAVLLTTPHPAGVLFIGAIAAYTLGRQVRFPLRDLPRTTAQGGTLVLVAAGLVIAIDVAVAALA
jgi:hypothetical protein